LLNNGFHSSVKINYKECKGYSNSNDRKSNYNKVKLIKKKNKRKVKSFFGISRDFYSCHLYSSSSFFNLCSSWNINGLNSEKKDGVMYLNSVLNLYVYAFRKLVIVSFSLMGTLLLFLVMSLFSFVLISKSLE